MCIRDSVIGRLGGFNAENLQVHDAGSDLSWMTYDNDGAESAMPALMQHGAARIPERLGTLLG